MYLYSKQGLSLPIAEGRVHHTVLHGPCWHRVSMESCHFQSMKVFDPFLQGVLATWCCVSHSSGNVIAGQRLQALHGGHPTAVHLTALHLPGLHLTLVYLTAVHLNKLDSQ